MTIKEFAKALTDVCHQDGCPYLINCPLQCLTIHRCTEIEVEDWLKFLVVLDKGEIETAHYCGNCEHLNGASCMVRDGRWVGEGKVCVLWQEKEK